MNNHVIMLIAGLLGVLLHVLYKVGQINKRLCTVNYKQIFAEYWKTDWVSVILSIVTVVIAVFLSNEWLNLKDTDKVPTSISEIIQYKLVLFIRTAFVIIGFCADSLVATYLGGTEQKLIQKAKDAGVPVEQIFNQKP